MCSIDVTREATGEQLLARETTLVEGDKVRVDLADNRRCEFVFRSYIYTTA